MPDDDDDYIARLDKFDRDLGVIEAAISEVLEQLDELDRTHRQLRRHLQNLG